MSRQRLVECLTNEVAQGVLHDCLEDGDAIPTRHFRDELSNEDLSFEDAWHVLRTGQIYDAPEQDIKTGEWKYRIEGYETGGKWIGIVFSFKEVDTVCLITIFSDSKRRRSNKS